MFNSRKTRSIAWESAQLSTWVKFMAYDWLSLNRLGNTGSRGRSKNNLRGIMMGIGPIWGITSLTPWSSVKLGFKPSGKLTTSLSIWSMCQIYPNITIFSSCQERQTKESRSPVSHFGGKSSTWLRLPRSPPEMGKPTEALITGNREFGGLSPLR